MLEHQGKVLNAFFSAGLLAICLACYILLLILFLATDTFKLDSLLSPSTDTIKPTVVVGVLSAVLSGATAAFVTRCVEQSLWLKLSSTRLASSNLLTVGESHHLAQWSVSPLERALIYPFRGASWVLKIAGLLLLGTFAMNPVLLSGISQRTDLFTNVVQQPNTVDTFAARIDEGNGAHRGGVAKDNPTTVAALAAMAGLSAPVSNVCNDPLCRIEAKTSAIHAQCKSSSSANPDRIGLSTGPSSESISREKYCSEAQPDLCVTLVSSLPYTYANFSSGYPPGCDMFSETECPPGSWSTLFGVWVNAPALIEEHAIHTVECALAFGNTTVVQDGTNVPTLRREDFEPASFPATDVTATDATGGMWSMNRIYTEYGSYNSPYSFDGQSSGTWRNTLYGYPVGYMLLGENVNNTGEDVARQIEANFDYATLSAFSRQTNASDMTITTGTETEVYRYDSRVLAILLIPLFATLLVVWGRIKVGDEDTVVTYSPIEIARRGPVRGLPMNVVLDPEEKKKVENWQIWGTKQDVFKPDGTRKVYVGFAGDGPTEGLQGCGK